MLEDRTFLVTGATGQLGCRTVNRLEELGARVIPLVFEGYSRLPKREPWTARVEPIMVSCAADLADLPGPDHVINYHWRMGSDLSPTGDMLYQIDHNLHRPSFLWDWLRDRAPASFVNASTVKVFSSLNVNPITAEAEPRPVSAYGMAKLTVEKYFDAHFLDTSCRVIHLRLCSVTSVGEHPSKMLSRLCASAFDHDRIRINVGHSICMFYIDDVVDLVINAALNGNPGRYTVTSEPIPISDLVSRFERVAGRRVNAEFVDLAPRITDPVFVSDVVRISADWTRSTTLETAIATIIAQRYPSNAEGYRPVSLPHTG